MEDAPLQNTLRVGKVNVGLIGLDTALANILNNRALTEDEAVAYLFKEISGKNYIPPEAEDRYREALRREYGRLAGKAAGHSEELRIRILGPGCVSCNGLQTLVIEILAKLGMAADIIQIHDLDEIGRHGVMTTPALIINDELKCAGRLPTPAKIEEWLRETSQD